MVLIAPRGACVFLLQRKKCEPGGDSGLGLAIVTLKPPENVTMLDLTYFNRFQHFRGQTSERELRLRTAVLHRSTSWKDHFQWALCLSTPPHTSPPHALAQRLENAPIMSCRGAVTHEHRLICGNLRCQGNRSLVHAGSACARDQDCTRYYSGTFASWVFCISYSSHRVPRRARLADASICNKSQASVLHDCQMHHP